MNIRAKTTSKKTNLKCYFCWQTSVWGSIHADVWKFPYLIFFSSFDSLFHTLPPLSLTLTRISLNKDFSSYRPFVPRRNLWSRRDILPCQLTDSCQTQSTQFRKELVSGMWLWADHIHLLCCDWWQALPFSLSMCSKASCVNMSSLSNVKSSCVRKESDPLTPAGQFPPAGCWETDQSDKRRPPSPSPSPLLLRPACRPLQDIVTLFCRVQQV